MLARCPTCDRTFENELRSTLCPHEAFPANNGDNTFTVHEDAYLSEAPKRVDFSCQVCGGECSVAPNPPARAVCEDHCEQVHGCHEYEYDEWRRGKFCRHCDRQESVD